MINQTAYNLGANRSVIRDLFEYGRSRAAIVGDENVFDFSLGNPSNFLLMHAMGPNVAGVIGSAIAAGCLLNFCLGM